MDLWVGFWVGFRVLSGSVLCWFLRVRCRVLEGFGGGVLLFASEALPDGYDHWAVCCVVCAVRGVLCVVCCVLCAVCCVWCAVCSLPCAVCCVLGAVFCMVCDWCTLLCPLSRVVCCVLLYKQQHEHRGNMSMKADGSKMGR